ncbi:MAG: hypothetical protein WCY30_00105 [Candidatus Neomarinimicrobiota bacterium]|jgi:hypothetical protein
MMDKKTEDLLKSAKQVVEKLSAANVDMGKEIKSLRQFKLAFDITAGMVAKDQLDPAEFQENVLELSGKESDYLLKKAEALSIDSVGLELGEPDERGKTAINMVSQNSPTPFSQESLEIARNMFS